MNDPIRKAANEAAAIRGARPNTNLKASSPSQNGADGNAQAMPPSITTKKFIANPIHITKRAFLYPHTSAIQSFRIYEIGKTIKPAVIEYEPN